jgi:glycosyltransferase involved in cell wall biosynthesis
MSDAAQAPLRVAVLVDLARHAGSGGHVKCWERIVEAATRRPLGDLDLTLHVQGDRDAVDPVAPHVRIHAHRPVFSTRRLWFLSHVPDHTDLAPRHGGLAAALADREVIHTTDGFFAFAGTARKLNQARGLPIVDSIHTDTPAYSLVFTRQTIERLVGRGWLARLLNDRLRIPARAAAGLRAKLERHHHLCHRVLVSNPNDHAQARRAVPDDRIGFLRLGIDHELFHPGRRDRGRLAASHGIPADRFLVLFAGRLDAIKDPTRLAQAVALLAADGRPIHLALAGVGPEGPAIARLLGPHATLLGFVPPDALAVWFASADLFAMPSHNETWGMVAAEAMAAGAPVLVAPGTAAATFVGDGGAMVDGPPSAWAEAIGRFIDDPSAARAMGRVARRIAVERFASWDQVLDEDLLPVWRSAAGRSLTPRA